MARSFTRASTSSLQFTVPTPLTTIANDTKTFAAVVAAGNLGTGVAWGTAVAMVFASPGSHLATPGHPFNGDYPPHNVSFGQQGSLVESTLSLDTAGAGWQMYAVTVTAATVEYYLHIWADQSWATDTDTSPNNATTLGAGGTYNVGIGSQSWHHFEGHIAAVAIWPRVLTSGEIRRLPRGRWDMTSPDFLSELPGGRDSLTTAKSTGRYPMKQSAGTASTRGTITDPPGFQFSPARLRR